MRVFRLTFFIGVLAGFLSGCGAAQKESEAWRGSFNNFQDNLQKATDSIDPAGLKLLIRKADNLEALNAALAREVAAAKGNAEFPYVLTVDESDHVNLDAYLISSDPHSSKARIPVLGFHGSHPTPVPTHSGLIAGHLDPGRYVLHIELTESSPTEAKVVPVTLDYSTGTARQVVYSQSPQVSKGTPWSDLVPVNLKYAPK